MRDDRDNLDECTAEPVAHAVHYSRASTGGRDDWATPDPLFRQLEDLAGGFALDAAANACNAKCARFLGPGSPHAEDALGDVSWRDVAGGKAVWLNPPYSMFRPFMERAAKEAGMGASVWCLVPSRTDTRAWHDVVMRKAARVYLVRGRVRFVGASAGAPFPSAVVVFGISPLGASPSFETLEQKR